MNKRNSSQPVEEIARHPLDSDGFEDTPEQIAERELRERFVAIGRLARMACPSLTRNDVEEAATEAAFFGDEDVFMKMLRAKDNGEDAEAKKARERFFAERTEITKVQIPLGYRLKHLVEWPFVSATRAAVAGVLFGMLAGTAYIIPDYLDSKKDPPVVQQNSDPVPPRVLSGKLPRSQFVEGEGVSPSRETEVDFKPFAIAQTIHSKIHQSTP